MSAPDEAAIDHRVAAFAFRLKNWVRPLGLHRLSLPCQLMGTGMAFPWEIISSADLATGDVVEDLKLGLDLARAGHPAVFCSSAQWSKFIDLRVSGDDVLAEILSRYLTAQFDLISIFLRCPQASTLQPNLFSGWQFSGIRTDRKRNRCHMSGRHNACSRGYPPSVMRKGIALADHTIQIQAAGEPNAHSENQL